jgi:hypothetical protein
VVKFFKWFSFSILLILIILLIGATFYTKNNLRPKIQPLVQKEISRIFKDSANFSFEDLDVNFVNKSADVSNIHFTLLDRDKSLDTIAYLTLDEVSFQLDNSYAEILSFDTLTISQLNLENPEVFLPLDFKKIQLNNAKKQSEDLMVFFLRTLIVREGGIELYNKKDESNGMLTAGVKINCDSLWLDEDFSLESFKPGDFGMSLFNVEYPLKDDLHHAKIEVINFNFNKGQIGLRNMIFEPKDDKERFAERMGVEKTYVRIEADSVAVLDWKWKEQDGIFAEEIKVSNGHLYAYKDKNYPLPDDRFIPILTDVLRKSQIPIHVNKVKIENSFIEYEELPEGKENTGKLHFDKVKGQITNISNVKDSIEKRGNELKIEASGNFYGQGKLETTMLYSLESPYFQIEGRLSKMEISPINNLTESMYPVKVESGVSDKVEFNFSGDNIKSAGKLKFYYTDLKIETEIKDEEGKLLDKVVSKIGNWVLPQENSESSEDGLKVGNFEYERDTRKSMFNFWAKSLVAGFKATFDVDKIEDAKERMEDEDKSLWEKIGIGNDDD